MIPALAGLAAVVSAGCPSERPAAPADDACLLVRRPLAPELVILHPDGREVRRPLLRPACAAVSHQSVAWADERGLHVEAGALDAIDVDPAPGSLVGRGCLAGVAVFGPRALIERKGAGVVVVDAAGERPILLPSLAPGEWVQGIARDGALQVRTSCAGRVLGADGQPVRRIDGPGSAVLGRTEPGLLVLDDGRRLAFPGGQPDAVWGRGDAFVVHLGETRVALIGARVVPLSIDQAAWADGDRLIISEHDGRVRAVDVDSEELLFQLPEGRDLMGQPLHRRVTVSVSWDTHARRLLVNERLIDAQCNASNNVVVVDEAGERRVIASGPKARTQAQIDHGVISYVEFALSYEPLGSTRGIDGALAGANDDNGTNVP